MFQADGTDLRDFELNETCADRRHPLLQLVPFRVAEMDQNGKDGEWNVENTAQGRMVFQEKRLVVLNMIL